MAKTKTVMAFCAIDENCVSDWYTWLQQFNHSDSSNYELLVANLLLFKDRDPFSLPLLETGSGPGNAVYTSALSWEPTVKRLQAITPDVITKLYRAYEWCYIASKQSQREARSLVSLFGFAMYSYFFWIARDCSSTARETN